MAKSRAKPRGEVLTLLCVYFRCSSTNECVVGAKDTTLCRCTQGHTTVSRPDHTVLIPAPVLMMIWSAWHTRKHASAIAPIRTHTPTPTSTTPNSALKPSAEFGALARMRLFVVTRSLTPSSSVDDGVAADNSKEEHRRMVVTTSRFFGVLEPSDSARVSR